MKRVRKCDTPQEAKEFIQSQETPSEYYERIRWAKERGGETLKFDVYEK